MDKNSEQVKDIALAIKKHRILEDEIYAKNKAIGLANVYYAGEKRQLWLTNSENTAGIWVGNDKRGNVQIFSTGHTTLTTDGHPIYKNTRIGECIIKNSSGIHEIKTPKGIQKIEIFNHSFYTPIVSEFLAVDLKMNLNEVKPRFYRYLDDLIQQIQDYNDKIEALRLRSVIERRRLEELKAQEDSELLRKILSEIEKSTQKKQDALLKAQNFIRKNAELRYQPVLDAYQEDIKRSNLFEGTIAIDGGPGTGKTTSLIQRIKFLTDKNAIDDYLPDLNKGLKEKLIDQKRSWVFFSPSELLKLYLKNNMVSEGLEASDDKVKVWSDFKSILIKKYRLINSETQQPFLVLRENQDISLLPPSGKQIKDIYNAFESYYLEFQKAKLQKLILLDLSKFSWKLKGISIQNFIKRQSEDYSLEGLIRLYFNIQENFSLEVKDIAGTYYALLKESIAKIKLELDRDKKISNEVKMLVAKWKTDVNANEESSIEDIVEIEEEFEDFENEYDQILIRKLKSLIRKFALKKYEKSQSLTTQEREMFDILVKVIDFQNYSSFDQLGQLALFIKYFERSTKGISSNLISEIPTLYKAFRKNQYKLKNNQWNFKLLGQIVDKESEKNKRLHPEEQAFILYFINNLIKKVYKVSPLKAEQINHPYFEAFREYSKPVIGIDEATDFHIIDLLCMYSLADHEISSVTFSGDLMQRFTKVGLRSWQELKLFIQKFEEKRLLISYRQSPTLLKLAQTIYQKANKKLPEYSSYLQKDDNEPKPLIYINVNESKCIEWIADRILEINRAYGLNIPSIAIFLPNEDLLEAFATKLGKIDRLADVEIKVKACNKGQVLGDANTIRVFSIEYIKGLEFEAVFFHNINQVFMTSDGDMILKNLYVGLSRASFYLGITSQKRISELDFLLPHFDYTNQYWKI